MMHTNRMAAVVVLALAAGGVAAAQERGSGAGGRSEAQGVTGAPVFFSSRADLERQVLDRWSSALAVERGIDAERFAAVVRTVPQNRLAYAAVARDAKAFLGRLSAGASEPRLIGGFEFLDTTFVPTTPCRIVDTRNGTGIKLAANETRGFVSNSLVNGAAFAAQGGDPSGCPEILGNFPAFVITLTIAAPDGIGNARAWPFSVPEPNASNINFRTGINIANTTTVTTCFMCASDFNVKVSQPAHVIIDVNGYFRTKDKTIDLRLTDVQWTNATFTTTPNRGFSIAAASNGGFQTSIFLPDDYSPNTEMAALFLMSNSTLPGCEISWVATQPLRDVFPGSNPGDPVTVTPNPLVGMPPAAANQTFFGIVGVEVTNDPVVPGDLLTLGWSRGMAPMNDCTGPLVVYGGQLFYR